jgi:hypothetical protein
MARSFRKIFTACFLTLGALWLYQLVFYATKVSPLQAASVLDLLGVAFQGIALVAAAAALVALFGTTV